MNDILHREKIRSAFPELSDVYLEVDIAEDVYVKNLISGKDEEEAAKIAYDSIVPVDRTTDYTQIIMKYIKSESRLN